MSLQRPAAFRIFFTQCHENSLSSPCAFLRIQSPNPQVVIRTWPKDVRRDPDGCRNGLDGKNGIPGFVFDLDLVLLVPFHRIEVHHRGLRDGGCAELTARVQQRVAESFTIEGMATSVLAAYAAARDAKSRVTN